MPLLVDTLRMPRAFPRNKPVGCARRPVQPREHVAVMEQKRRGEYVSEKYGKLVEAVELELQGVCDLTDGKHRGRADGA